jgi:hypothetical protein
LGASFAYVQRSVSRKLPAASGDAEQIFAQSPILRQDRLRHHGCHPIAVIT